MRLLILIIMLSYPYCLANEAPPIKAPQRDQEGILPIASSNLEKRSNIALGIGMSKDQTSGSAGLYIHARENNFFRGGILFGNEEDWASFIEWTFRLPKFKK